MIPPDKPPAGAEANAGRREAVARNPWAYPVMWMAIVLLLVAGGIYLVKSCRAWPGETFDKASRAAEKLGEQLQKVAAAFAQGTITTSFISSATSITGSQYLQIATLTQTETFTRKDEASVAFGYIPLPEIIVQATAPVTYTYYLDLNERWDFRLEGGVVYVTAPDIQFNKPAVDASRLTYEVRKDSLLRNTTEARESLKKSITWLSYKKAEANIELVREMARRQAETFVHNWLARSFADGKGFPVEVRFRSETNGLPAGPVSQKD